MNQRSTVFLIAVGMIPIQRRLRFVRFGYIGRVSACLMGETAGQHGCVIAVFQAAPQHAGFGFGEAKGVTHFLANTDGIVFLAGKDVDGNFAAFGKGVYGNM